MKRTCGVILMMSLALWAAPASAQTPAPASSAGVGSLWYVGANIGTAVVDSFSATGGLEGGRRVWRNLDAVGELAWIGNAVSRRQLDKVATLATYIGQRQNTDASSDLTAKTRYGGLGVRWVFEQEMRLEPYVMVTLGGSHTTLKPTLRLQGTDITDAAAQYGVTLGRDVIGESNDFAAEMAVGVILRRGTWFGDASARLLSSRGGDQRTNIARLVIGGGYQF
ncbi:MAG: hypothetical protein ABI051_08470 [Vicinamibacterales bacterium]